MYGASSSTSSSASAPPWVDRLRATLTSGRGPAPHTTNIPAQFFPYQKDAVEFALARGGRALFGHEMGLGKTAMAIVLASHYDLPALVVAPPILMEQWAAEIRRWLPQLRKEEVQVVKKGADRLRAEARWVIVSYDTLSGKMVGGARSNAHLRATAAGAPWQLIIADEAHKLKSVEAARTQTLLPLLHRARHAVLMTGTPLTNSCAADLYPLLSAIVGDGRMPPIRQWNEHYCLENAKITLPTGRQIDRWVGVHPEREGSLRDLLALAMARKTKAEVLTQLPAKRRFKIELQLTEKELKPVLEQMKTIRSFERDAEAAGGASGDEPGLPTPELMKAFRLLAEAKTAAVGEWIKEALIDGDPTGGKVLIFAHHHSVHDRLAEALRKALDQPAEQLIHITGRTRPEDRDRLLAKFKTERRCRFALLSLTACSQGLNLTEASTCVFAELCWTPAMIDQAESRIHRMGQQAAAVNLYYLLATSSKFAGDDDRLPDGAMFGALVKKAQVASRVVDPHAAASSLADAQVVTPRPRAARREEADDDDDAGGADGEMPTPPRAGRRADAADPPGAPRKRPRTSEEEEGGGGEPMAAAAAAPRVADLQRRLEDARKTTRIAREDASRLAAEAERGARRAAHAAEAEARLEAELAAAVAAAVPEPPRLSTSEMKRALDAADVDTTGCIERSDVERLYKWSRAERCPTCDCALPYPPRRRVRHIRNCSGVRA